MLTLYYLMKKSRSGVESDIIRYYSRLIQNRPLKTRDLSSKCRICLQEGESPIPDDAEFLEALHVFGNIQIDSHEDHPNRLCNKCHKFIEEAILFRKIALQTEELLKQPVKQEMYEEQSQDYSDSSVNNEHIEEWTEKSYHSVKSEKLKPKLAEKVTCKVCNKVLNQSYYKEHMTMHDPDHKRFVCDVCGKSFRLRCSYYNHSLRHRSDFPFKCQFCPYRGKYSELLKTHMKTHTGDYRYMCTECPARFLFKSNLNSHMLRHKERQFKCDLCKRAYHTKPMLQSHYEVHHLGIKNHICNVCGKAFGFRKALMKHQRHVHKREKLLSGRMPSYLREQNSMQDAPEGDVILQS